MKKLLALLAVLIIFPIGVLAQEEVACPADVFTCPDGTEISRTPPDCEFYCSTSEPSAGTEPDSLFYGLDLFLEKIQLKFVGGELRKAKLHLKFAGERLAEAKKMTLKYKEKFREEAMEKYEEEMNETVEAVEKARGIGQDVSQIVKEISVSVAKHIEVLELVKAKVPEQARISIERNINRSKERVEEFVAKKAEKEEAKEGENESVTAKSDVTVGGAVVKKIAEEFEKLNPVYESKGKNNSEDK